MGLVALNSNFVQTPLKTTAKDLTRAKKNHKNDIGKFKD